MTRLALCALLLLTGCASTTGRTTLEGDLAAEARVDGTRMRAGQLWRDDWPKLARAAGTLSELPLWIDARVMEREQVIIGGGSRDRKLLVPPATLALHPGAEVVEDLAKTIE